MELPRGERLQALVEEGTDELYGLWDEIGLDVQTQHERHATVEEHFRGLLDRMINEEKGLKKKLLDSLEHNTKQCHKLSKELGVEYEEPGSNLALLNVEHTMRAEAKRLAELKEERMKEVLKLRRQDEELCRRLGLDPYYISSTTVPTTQQLEGLLDHIRALEEEKFVLEEKFIKMKDDIIRLYGDLETEPSSEFERDIACEETDRFTLSSANMGAVSGVLSKLEDMVKVNQREVMMAVERLDSLYARLQLNMEEKYDFLAENPGHSPSTIKKLQLEIERLEEIKRANIEKFINTLRNELHKLWDRCFYSPDQRNLFSPLHSVDFTETLLEQHEEEAERMKKYLTDHQDLFDKVAQRQEVWNKFMELERRAKDPSRLMNARGNSLLQEEKERNKVNKALPRVEGELQELISCWERQHGSQFLVGGVSFAAFIEQQKEEHAMQLESEKMAREKAKKETLLQETRFGHKPSTPAKLKGHSSSIKTPRKMQTTPSSAKFAARVKSAVNSSMRSPRAGKVAKGVSPRLGGKKQEKNKKIIKATEAKIKRGVLAEVNNTVVNGNINKTRGGMSNLSVASNVPDYDNFKQGNMLNSTEANINPTSARTPTHNYLTPTRSSQSRVFKTPTTPGARARLGNSSSKLSTLRNSSKNLPVLL